MEIFKKLSRELFAYLSEEELQLQCFAAPRMLREFLEQQPLLDLACVGIMGQEEIVLLQNIRKLYTKAEILLVADAAVSPMEYLTPAVRAASLLLYPYTGKQHRQVFREFMENYLAGRGQADNGEFLVIENREGRTRIPLQQIYYIEVRERKVFIRIQGKEYSKYDTLEHVLEQLPDHFIRCHRSFAFNLQHLDKIRLSENAVYLEHGIMVPLSRSYKQSVKECVHGTNRE